MNYKIEIARNNVTPAKFFAEIRFACKKKGIDFALTLEEFANPIQHWNSSYIVKDGKKISHWGNDYKSESDGADAPCASEVCRILPYDFQMYARNFDGSCFNEICEFVFDDEKTGHGYYYQMNKEANK